MRDQMACKERKGLCSHLLPENIIFKDVVVIGNGPSGLCTSYMLSGWLPHLAPGPLQTSDEMLSARLSSLTPGQCLLDADLPELAEGLEGRSHNPVPLLMDNLQYPCADMGLDLDPLIEWRFNPDKQVDHIVLGSGPAGGAWHSFASKVLTLSPARWLSLPPHRTPWSNTREGEGLKRAHAQAVADYYRQYVSRMGLQKYFRSGVVVQRVRRVRPAPASASACGQTCPLRAAWCVQGYDIMSGEQLTYVSTRVVLACGSSDSPHHLPACPPDTVHAGDTDHILDTYCAGPDSLPVLVVGSGLSAADAIVRARSSGASVLHVYQKAAVGLRDLSPSVYPEYHQVYQMMCKGTSGNFERYTALPEHEIQHVAFVDNLGTAQDQTEPENAELKPKLVKFLNIANNTAFEKTVSLIFVLIGSRPNLNFLPDDLNTNLFVLKINERPRHNRKPRDTTRISDGQTLDACCDSRNKSRDRRSWTLDAVSEWDRDRVCAHTDTPENVMKSHSERPDDTSVCLKCAYNNNTSVRCYNENTMKNKKKCMKNELKSRWSNLKQVLGRGCKLRNNYEDEIEYIQIDVKDDNIGRENYDVITNRTHTVRSANNMINCDSINGINGNGSVNMKGRCNNGKSDSVNVGCKDNGDRNIINGGNVDGMNGIQMNGNSSCSNGNGSVNMNGSYLNGNGCCTNGYENMITNGSYSNSSGSCTNDNINGSYSNGDGSSWNGNKNPNVNDSYINGSDSCLRKNEIVGIRESYINGNGSGRNGNVNIITNVGNSNVNGSCSNCNMHSSYINVNGKARKIGICSKENDNMNRSFTNSNSINSNCTSPSSNGSYTNVNGSDVIIGSCHTTDSDNINGCRANGKRSNSMNDSDGSYTNGDSNIINEVNGYSSDSGTCNGFDVIEINGVLNENDIISNCSKRRDLKDKLVNSSSNVCKKNDLGLKFTCENSKCDSKLGNVNSGCKSNSELGLGLGYGLDPSKPIDCRGNPVNVDKRTHQVRNFGKGLYALGPLTGDNFVRFIPGGALAIVSHIWRENDNLT